jgi:isopenicillin N synthase-like dioxygenase
MSGIPEIDLAPFRSGDAAARRATARAFGEAFERIGFATIVGHGIDEDLIRRSYDLANAFFDLPLAEKLAASVPDRVKTRGYLPVGIESVARTRNAAPPPDLCEALVFYAMHRDPPDAVGEVAPRGNVYPARPPALGAVYRAYFVAAHGLVLDLMRLSALALDLPEDFFAPFYDRMRGTLRTVFYPDQPAAPAPGQLRYGAHSDYGGLTVLRQDDAPGGLQAQTVDGAWLDVRPTPGSFVINIGDLMARWTNDRWRSTVHRVMNPPRAATGSTRRLSLVFFSGPNDDAVIECLPSCRDPVHPPRYAPVVAREYIRSKLDASMPAELAAR